MKNAVEAELVDLPKLQDCQFVDAFVNTQTVRVQNAGKMKEELEVRKKPLTITSLLDLKNAAAWVRVLVVDMMCCNDSELKMLDFSRFSNLRELKVGDKCFKYVEEVKLIGLSQLERVVIGKVCCIDYENCMYYHSNGRFYLKNCKRLRELKIGNDTFYDYSVCEIENNDSLEVIEMGVVNEGSYPFRFASLELRSDFDGMK